jgi:hypothetical protein
MIRREIKIYKKLSLDLVVLDNGERLITEESLNKVSSVLSGLDFYDMLDSFVR